MRVELRVEAGPDGDAAERADLALRLRSELLRLEEATVAWGGGETLPLGAKAGETATVGSTLVVSLISSGAVTALITTVNSWLARQRRGSVSIKLGDDELTLTSATSEDQRQVIDAWLEQHGGATDSGG
jgi:hypothetical protein